jgi:hypothetical protein
VVPRSRSPHRTRRRADSFLPDRDRLTNDDKKML